MVVHLDKDVFFPGERVTGQVCVLNGKARRCTGISVTFQGRAEVLLACAAARYDTQRPATEDYYCRETSLWRDPSEKLQPGKYIFPFHFDLPSNAPATFQGLYGNVEHCVKVQMKVKRSLDPKVKKIFTLLSGPLPEPHNTLTDAVQSRVDTSLSAKCGDVTVKVEVDGTIYDPRDTIIVDADITNKSSKKITSISAVFYMSVDYSSRRSSRTQQYQVAARSHEGVAPGGSLRWVDDLVVPILPATGLHGCGIISVSYGLKFTAHRKLPSSSLVLDFPIIIGSALSNGAVHHLDPAPPCSASPASEELRLPLSAFSQLSISDNPSDTSFSSSFSSSSEENLERSASQGQLESLAASTDSMDSKVSSKLTRLVSKDSHPSYFRPSYVFQNSHRKTRT